MAGKGSGTGAKVMRSIETPDGVLCVDLVRGADDVWSWAEYRRDPEDGRGWYPTGASGGPCADEAAALAAAVAGIGWLSAVLPDSTMPP